MDTTKKIAVMLGVCFMTSLSVAGATFHPGDKGHQITEIQQALTAHGYDTDADGDYGDSTQAAVRQFQADHGLDCDGIIGAATYEALMGEAMPENRTSQGGAASDALPAVTADNEVRVIQQALANNGYTVDVDGVLASGRSRPSASSRPTMGWKRTASSASRLFMPLPGRACPTVLSAVSAMADIMAWPASKVRRLRISSTLPTSISAFPISLAVRRRPASTAPASRATSIRQPASTCRAVPTNSMA